MKGQVDHKGRPTIELPLPGKAEPLLAHIDTGCTFSLVMDQAVAAELGVTALPRVSGNPRLQQQVHLADGSAIEIPLGRLSVIMDGVLRLVTVGITPNSAIPGDGPNPDKEPKALLGCQLLAGKSLNINFSNGRIDIASCLTPPA